ncbi:hypothetical protein NKI96_22480 [Mesorhizobium sp. M0292]|uniref:hypothetical protein n=1 Tax=Mesorhizobium sp. M0292 TaxID=2956929 RepID=UPI003339736D
MKAELERHPIFGEVRGVGILSAVQLMWDPKGRAPFEAALFENGVIGRAMPHGDILGFAHL